MAGDLDSAAEKSIIDLDAIIRGMSGGTDKTSLTDAIEVVIAKVAGSGLNELPARIAAVRAGRGQ